MNRQCKCTDCGYVFDYEDAGGVRENHWLDGEYMGSETFLVCPNCGGDFENAVDCCKCGETFTENELYDGWCEKCLRETSNGKNHECESTQAMLRFLEEVGDGRI